MATIPTQVLNITYNHATYKWALSQMDNGGITPFVILKKDNFMKMEQGVSTNNNDIAILKSEIEFLKQEISILKALCQDFRMTMESQDEKQREALREQLASGPKTRFSQATEMCPARYDCRPHQWEKITHSGRTARIYSQCRFCGEEQINSARLLCFS